MNDEEALVRAAAAGDRGAFGRLAREHEPRLRRFVGYLCVSDADDLAQEALTKAFQAISSFRGESKFSSWLLGIALNVCREWRRRTRPTVSDQQALDGIDRKSPDRSILTSLVRRENAEKVALALDELPEVFREAFVLHHVEGLDFKEIGRLTDTCDGTARVRAFRARTLLQSELGSSFLTLFQQARKEKGGAKSPEP